MSDIDFDVSVSDVSKTPIEAIFKTFFTSILDISLNVGISVVLELAFPAYDAHKNVWLSLFEGVLEISLHVLLSNMLLLVGGEWFGTRNTLAPWGALVGIWLLNSALTKLWAFEQYLIAHVSGSIASKSNDSQVKEVLSS